MTRRVACIKAKAAATTQEYSDVAGVLFHSHRKIGVAVGIEVLGRQRPSPAASRPNTPIVRKSPITRVPEQTERGVVVLVGSNEVGLTVAGIVHRSNSAGERINWVVGACLKGAVAVSEQHSSGSRSVPIRNR